jgi:tripartite-type tricarboxylate transporter receptor subunit TctC
LKKIFGVLLAFAVTGMVFAGGGSEGAANYPEKPVQCIIPYAPGGGSDVLTRAIMKDIKMKQPLVAVNIEGGAGLVGANQALDAKPDGYTILAHNPLDLIGFDLGGLSDVKLWAEFETVAMVVADYDVVNTNKASGWKTIEDVVAFVKANPGQKVKWGVSGARSVNMANTQRIARDLGIFDNITFVPYDGGAGTRKALMGDEVRLETATASETKALAASGDTIPLLVMSEKRIKPLPNTPTTVEKGIKVAIAKWRGYFAPKGTPKAALEYLEKALKEVVANSEFVNTVENKLNFTANFVGGADAKAQIAKWREEIAPGFKDLK